MSIKVKGQKALNRVLKRAVSGVIENVVNGMTAAVKFLQAASNAKIPVEKGDLIRSSFTDVSAGSRGITGTVGYNEEYAAYVHEKPGTLKGQPRPSGIGSYWSPDGEPKFLQNAAVRNTRKILSIIRRHAGRSPRV